MTNKNHFRLQFETPDSFGEFIANAKPAWDFHSSDRKSDDSGWNGTATYEQAVDLFLNGWPEGRELLHSVSADMKGATSVEVQEVETKIRDVAGDVPDVPAAIAGDPENMISSSRVSISSPIVRVVVAADMASNVSPEQIMNRGGAILSYIDALESAGWRCEVVYYVESKDGRKRFALEAVIKQAQDFLDIDRLAFCLANPAMLRRLFFRAIESVKECESFYSGYGSPACERPIDADLYFPYTGGCYDADTALDYAQSIVDEQLVNVA